MIDKGSVFVKRTELGFLRNPPKNRHQCDQSEFSTNQKKSVEKPDPNIQTLSPSQPQAQSWAQAKTKAKNKFIPTLQSDVDFVASRERNFDL